jgi:hypothetical protein
MFYRSGLSKPLVEIIKKMMPKATDFDFHQLRQFQQASPFFFCLFFLSWRLLCDVVENISL